MTTHLWLILAWLATITAAVSVLMAPAMGRLTWHFWIAVAVVCWLTPQVFA
jgi:hypothetical protein